MQEADLTETQQRLEIDIQVLDGTNTISIGGDLVGERAASLAEVWPRWSSTLGERCIVDVSGICIIDACGRLALRRIAEYGVRFKANGPITVEIINLICEEQRRAIQLRQQFRTIVFWAFCSAVCIFNVYVSVCFSSI
jgi:hypothetical protein